jgi:putative addiction module CopG family antidote
MPIVVPPDVEQSVASQLATGRYSSEEDVLRSAMQALVEFDEDLVAVEQAIAEWRNGDPGIPLDEAFRRIRETGEHDGAS